MSDELNPLADIPADMPEDNVREYGAALVRNGMAVDDVNKHLTARGAAPLVSDSLEMAEFRRDRLLADPEFANRYLNGDPDATVEVNLLDLRIAKGGGKLTDRDVKAGDYDLKLGVVARDLPEADLEKLNEGLAKLAADLKLPPDNARSLAAQHVAAVSLTAGMSDEEREGYGRDQAAILESALGADADARIKAASAVLSRVSGRPLDIAAIVKSNGAEAALTLLHQAEHLAVTKRA